MQSWARLGINTEGREPTSPTPHSNQPGCGWGQEGVLVSDWGRLKKQDNER